MKFKIKTIAILSVVWLLAVIPIKQILAFCGFYVAKADASLYNQASRVVVVHNDNKTVISMMNDYQGELKDFALVVPVPSILEKDQIHVGDSKIIDHLDAYSAPRLVEYFDPDPCQRYEEEDSFFDIRKKSKNSPVPSFAPVEKKDLGVKVEASYTIGEYDIQILSAKYSDGLETWLNQNGYKIPKGASEALRPYIKQKLKFFVAKVNLKSMAQGLTFLRPLQFAYESPKFMLPIRLGMLNAKGEQDLLIYMLSRDGRVETTNYRTVKLPSDLEIPEFVKNDFGTFYKSMFNEQARKENHSVVFTEYVWNMSWCDPCAAEPLSNNELQQLGVFWLADNQSQSKGWNGNPPQVMVTRLHIRYNNETFPEDLVFQETKDQTNFQGRYIIQHPWKGNPNQCSRAKEYFKQLRVREEQRAENYRMLTGLELNEIKSKMKLKEEPKEEETKWWKKIWK